jgi:hypothetical protein
MGMVQGFAKTFDPFEVAAFDSCASSINISSLRDEKSTKEMALHA